ncbi:MAG: hypothetical protein JRS35_02330 [Deltaproteobacteria bacterium]|nr:hypothetical protein [Deltaproteobacteria bacterium]
MEVKARRIDIECPQVSRGRYVTFQSAEVAVPRKLFREILRRIDELRQKPDPVYAEEIHSKVQNDGRGASG